MADSVALLPSAAETSALADYEEGNPHAEEVFEDAPSAVQLKHPGASHSIIMSKEPGFEGMGNVLSDEEQKIFIKRVRAMDPEAIEQFRTNPSMLSVKWANSLENFLQKREKVNDAGMRIQTSNGLNVPSGLHGFKQRFDQTPERLAHAMRFQIWVAQKLQIVEWENTDDLKWSGFSVKPGKGHGLGKDRNAQSYIKHLLALSATELVGCDQVIVGTLDDAEVRMQLPTKRGQDHADLSRKAFPDTKPKHPSSDKKSFQKLYSAVMNMCHNSENGDSPYWTPDLIQQSNNLRSFAVQINNSIAKDSIPLAWQKVGELAERLEEFIKIKHSYQKKLYKAQAAEVTLKIQTEGYTYAEAKTKDIKSWNKTYCAPFYKLASIGEDFAATQEKDNLTDEFMEYKTEIENAIASAEKIWRQKDYARTLQKNRNTGERYAHYEQDKMMWPAIMPMKLAVYLMMMESKDRVTMYSRNEKDTTLPGAQQIMACRLFKVICNAYSENYGKEKIIERMNRALIGDLAKYRPIYRSYVDKLSKTDVDRAYAAALTFGKIKAGANIWVDAKATSGLTYCADIDKVLNLYVKERDEHARRARMSNPGASSYEIAESWNNRIYFSTAASIYRKWIMSGSADRCTYQGFVYGVYSIGEAEVGFGGEQISVHINYKSRSTVQGFCWEPGMLDHIRNQLLHCDIFKKDGEGTHRGDHLSFNVAGVNHACGLGMKKEQQKAVWKWDSGSGEPYKRGYFAGCTNQSSCCYGAEDQAAGGMDVAEADVDVDVDAQ